MDICAKAYLIGVGIVWLLLVAAYYSKLFSNFFKDEDEPAVIFGSLGIGLLWPFAACVLSIAAVLFILYCVVRLAGKCLGKLINVAYKFVKKIIDKMEYSIEDKKIIEAVRKATCGSFIGTSFNASTCVYYMPSYDEDGNVINNADCNVHTSKITLGQNTYDLSVQGDNVTITKPDGSVIKYENKQVICR